MYKQSKYNECVILNTNHINRKHNNFVKLIIPETFDRHAACYVCISFIVTQVLACVRYIYIIDDNSVNKNTQFIYRLDT